jgi:hypothetical protein
METYRQSILEYDDVRQAVDYAYREGYRKGIKIGRKRGLEQIVKNCSAYNISVETIATITGFTERRIYDILNNG